MRAEGAFAHPAASAYETGNNSALATAAAILSWIEMLFKSSWKFGVADGLHRRGVGNASDDSAVTIPRK